MLRGFGGEKSWVANGSWQHQKHLAPFLTCLYSEQGPQAGDVVCCSLNGHFGALFVLIGNCTMCVSMYVKVATPENTKAAYTLAYECICITRTAIRNH